MDLNPPELRQLYIHIKSYLNINVLCPNNLNFYALRDLRKTSFQTCFCRLLTISLRPVPCCPFFSSSSYSAWPLQKCTEYHRTDSLTTPFSYLLRAAFWVLHGAGHASRAQSCETLETELRKTCKRLSNIARQTDGEKTEREGRDGLESGLAGASRQSLNKAGEKARNTGRGESKRAAGPGLPRTHRQLLLDCLLESDRATPRISTPLPYTFLSFEKWPPISPSPLRKPPIQSLSFFFFFFSPPTTWAQVHSAT